MPTMQKNNMQHTRDNRELLFAFKKRALVHFAVDPDEVYMATKIDGSETRIGFHSTKATTMEKAIRQIQMAIKPTICGKNILEKDSWMDIIQSVYSLAN